MKPVNLKYAKSQKGSINMSIKKSNLIYGEFGLVANEPGIINASQLAAAVLALKRSLKKEGNTILRVFTHTPVTKKPSEVRMGKGKGSVSHYITKIQKGSFILEIKIITKTSATSTLARNSLSLAKSKLPVSTSIVCGVNPSSF
jgi:large subunit ribosomal protein L16